MKTKQPNLEQAIAGLKQEIQTRQQRFDALQNSATVSPTATLNERLTASRAAVEIRPEVQALSTEINILEQELSQHQAELAQRQKQDQNAANKARIETEVPRLSAIAAELNQASGSFSPYNYRLIIGSRDYATPAATTTSRR